MRMIDADAVLENLLAIKHDNDDIIAPFCSGYTHGIDEAVRIVKRAKTIEDSKPQKTVIRILRRHRGGAE